MRLHRPSHESRLCICVLDYDGVVHDDAVYFSPDRGVFLETPDRYLFEWLPVLESLLAPHPHVKIVLSTSWVRNIGFDFAKRQLSPGLQERVIGATFDNRIVQKAEFDFAPRGLQVCQDMSRRCPDAWFAIDDDVAGWPEHFRDRLVLTDSRAGLSAVSVQAAVREQLRTMHRLDTNT